MTGQEPTAQAMFEIAVRGGIGPVLQWALRPCSTRGVQAVTVVQTRGGGPADLVDLLRRLDARGVDVEDIRRVG
jgi:hypothetical protein